MYSYTNVPLYIEHFVEHQSLQGVPQQSPVAYPAVNSSNPTAIAESGRFAHY